MGYSHYPGQSGRPLVIGPLVAQPKIVQVDGLNSNIRALAVRRRPHSGDTEIFSLWDNLMHTLTSQPSCELTSNDTLVFM